MIVSTPLKPHRDDSLENVDDCLENKDYEEEHKYKEENEYDDDY